MINHCHDSVFFFEVYSWLVKVLGQFPIIYFRGVRIEDWG